MRNQPTALRVDQVATASFLLVGLALVYALVGTARPVIIPNADSANVASFIAGWLQPEAFANDLVLGQRQNFQFYVSLVMPVVALLNIATRDLGLAFCLTLLPIVFFQCLGFYRLGLMLQMPRLLAYALALVSLTPVGTISGELWGLLPTPLVRMAYGAALPWLLMLALNPQVSAVRLMGWCALASYLHLVSGPGMALALLVGRLAFGNHRGSANIQAAALTAAKSTRGFWAYVVALVPAGLWYLLLMLPYVALYLLSFPALEPNSNQTAAHAWDAPTAYTQVRIALQQLYQGGMGNPYLSWGWRGWAALASMVGLVILATRKKSLHATATAITDTEIAPRLVTLQARFLLLTCAGCLLGSVGFSALDQGLAAFMGSSPVQADLIRNSKFLVPLLFIAFCFSAAQLATWTGRHTATASSSVKLIPITAVAVLAFWSLPYFNHTAGALLSGLRSPAQPLAQHFIVDAPKAVAYLRDHPTTAAIVVLGPEELGLAVRYGALRSVAWVAKDRNALFYSSSHSMREWQHRRQLVQTITAARTNPQITRSAGQALCQLVHQTGASRILLDNNRYPRLQYLPELGASTPLWKSPAMQLFDATTLPCKPVAGDSVDQ